MEKTTLELTLKDGVDAFKLSDYLNSFQNIKANVVTLDSIRVRFSPDKIAEKVVLKLIQAFSKKHPRDRKANVKGIKLITYEGSFRKSA